MLIIGGVSRRCCVDAGIEREFVCCGAWHHHDACCSAVHVDEYTEANWHARHAKGFPTLRMCFFIGTVT